MSTMLAKRFLLLKRKMCFIEFFFLDQPGLHLILVYAIGSCQLSRYSLGNKQPIISFILLLFYKLRLIIRLDFSTLQTVYYGNYNLGIVNVIFYRRIVTIR